MPVSKVDGIVNSSFSDLLTLMGTHWEFRDAMRDFNQVLINPDDCPLLLYRAIETLAKLISKNWDKKTDWNTFHDAIGTKREDLEELLKINEQHRHGNRIRFSKEQHINMLETAKYFLSHSIKYLLQNKHLL